YHAVRSGAGVVAARANAPVRFQRYGLLVSVVLVCLLLLTVQTRGGGSGGAGEAVAILLTPVQSLLVKIHRGAVGVWPSYVDWAAVRRENWVLRAEAERLGVQGLRAAETDQETARLRRLLELHDRLPMSALAGEVIGRESGGWVRALTVNRGRRSGIAQQTPVIVPAGLDGRGVQVRLGASVVQLVNGPASALGAADP